MPLSGCVSFGPFHLDIDSGELRKAGRILKLQPQPARVLALLVEHAGTMVSREDIRRLLWGDSTHVDYDLGVDYCVSRIRAALSDKTRGPRYIETIPRRGYRFIALAKRQRLFVEPTLAVLPFANLNGDPAMEYFADGVTDALITELAKIPSLRVISRQSTLHLKGSRRRVAEIVRHLGVDGVVEGAALREDSHVRVTAQLILAEPERHVWAEAYDCDVGAVLSSQRHAARAIAACVVRVLKTSGSDTRTAAPSPAVAADIVEAYLRARAELGKMNAEGIGAALALLRDITTSAPDFAPALAQYALCLGSLGYWGHAPMKEVMPAATQLTLQALAIDDSLETAHLALAMGWVQNWDNLSACEQEFQRAIQLSPSNPEAHMLYAIFLCSFGRYAQAVAEVDYAIRLDPTSLLPSTAAAWIHLNVRQYGKAEALARRIIAVWPDSLHAHFVLGWAVWAGKRAAEAVAEFEKAMELSREPISLAFLAYIYGAVGRTDDARRLLNELDQLRIRGFAPIIAFVIAHAGLGETDAAFELLETACRVRDDKLLWLSCVPAFDSLRPDPRFAEIFQRMGLPRPVWERRAVE